MIRNKLYTLMKKNNINSYNLSKETKIFAEIINGIITGRDSDVDENVVTSLAKYFNVDVDYLKKD